MSIEALNWALDAEVGGAGEKVVLIVLANYATESRRAWPTQQTIARKACISPRSVRNHLVALEARGLIARMHRQDGDGRHLSDVYLLNIPHQRQDLPTEEPAAVQEKPVEPRRQDLPPDRRQKLHEPAANFATRTTIEPSEIHNARARVDYPPEFEAAWRLYPQRTGNNPKRDAYRAWRARLAAGHTIRDLTEGVARYGLFVRATGKVGTEYVMQAARFFGPAEPFLEPWTTPTGGHPHATRQPSGHAVGDAIGEQWLAEERAKRGECVG